MTSPDWLEQVRACMQCCRICPRECGVDRWQGKKGFCGMDASLRAGRAALHMWEEPCISGREGSGAVFFSGCSVRCIFCQNYEIAGGRSGKRIRVEDLAEVFLRLQGQGANNINLVTATHFAPQAAAALRMAKDRGLEIPVIYNSSGYEKAETLAMLEGLVDVYLPDYKYIDPDLAASFSGARDYPVVVREAVRVMTEQTGPCLFDERGMIRKGVIVRHLLLPGHVRDAQQIIHELYTTYGDRIWISMMNQYTPMQRMKDHPLLGRKVTRREYDRLVDYALSIGLENGFIQEGETAKESFIPAFDGEGIGGFEKN